MLSSVRERPTYDRMHWIWFSTILIYIIHPWLFFLDFSSRTPHCWRICPWECTQPFYLQRSTYICPQSASWLVLLSFCALWMISTALSLLSLIFCFRLRGKILLVQSWRFRSLPQRCCLLELEKIMQDPLPENILWVWRKALTYLSQCLAWSILRLNQFHQCSSHDSRRAPARLQ